MTNNKVIKLGISTCPNDTFMFDALIHQKIETKGYTFDVTMADVEELNKMAFNNVLDMTKMSYAQYLNIKENYQLLTSGSALGNNNGPLLISKRKIYPDEINNISIAIPGINTTANLLMSDAFPEANDKREYLFSDIEEAILTNEVDAGVIIHETRFTYHKKGLKLIADLGKVWQEKTNLPIPLGGIVIRREFDSETKNDIDRLLSKSIQFAFDNPDESYKFVKNNAQNMADDVMFNHIRLYVNSYSKAITDKGKEAVISLLKKHSLWDSSITTDNIFI